MNKELVERERIDEKYKWDVESLYKNIDHWEKDYEKLNEKLNDFKQYENTLKSSPKVLLNSLRDYENIYRLVGNLYSYASLKQDEDTRVAKYQALADKAFRVYIKASETTAFFLPEILDFEEKQIKNFIEAENDLALYEHYLKESLRKKEHVLSAREEEILAQVSEIGSSSENIYSMLSNADLKFPKAVDSEGKEYELTSGSYIPLMESKDRVLRKSAFKNLYGVYKGLENTFAASLDGELKANKFFANMRKYKNTMEASLDKNNIDVKVYKNLIKSVHDNLQPMYKYIDIRKRVMGLDSIHMYDIYNPIVSNVDSKYSFEEAKEIIRESLKPLGEKYLNIVDEGFNSRWIDVYENKGKRSGGYSGGSYDSKPFILLNYKDTLDSVFTTTHEMGHSIHSYLSRKNQPYIYSGYSIFVAEVASTVNEVLLINYLLDNAKDKDEKTYIINHFIDSFRGTVYRQTMFAEFEKNINDYIAAGGALTSDYLNKEYRELNSLYFGNEMILDEEINVEWARIPHFYYNYYVYQYATGFAAAVNIANKILKGEDNIVDKYIEFLSSGSSDYPLNILEKLGIDMRKPHTVNQALDIFNQLVDDLDKLI